MAFLFSGNNLQNSMVPSDSSEASPTQIKTKKLFVTGMALVNILSVKCLFHHDCIMIFCL